MKNALQLIIAFWNSAKKWAKGYTDTVFAHVSAGITYKGAVNYYDDLPTAGQEVGDAYVVRYTGSRGTTLNGAEYAWSPVDGVEQWVYIGNDMASKADKAIPTAAGNLAALDASGNLKDAGFDLNSKIDKVIPETPGNLAALDAEGNLQDAGFDLNSKVDKAVPAATGNLAALDAEGNLIDAGCTAASKAAVDHTHTAAQVGAAAVDHTHTAADVGADASGTAASAVSTHNSAADAHSTQFAGKAAVDHTHTAADVGADASGTAASAVSTHNSAADAHSTQFAAKADLSDGKVPKAQIPLALSVVQSTLTITY